MNQTNIHIIQQSLIDFLNQSPTMYQVEKTIKSILVSAGAVELKEEEKWDLEPGTMYLVSRNNASLLAFRLGEEPIWQKGFTIGSAHTDSPLLKLKPESQDTNEFCVLASTEVYGGPIFSSWIDRELCIAGSLCLRNGSKTTIKEFSLSEPIGIIPNLAIHLNRDINKGFAYNQQDHLKLHGFHSIPDRWSKKPLEYVIGSELDIDPELITGGDWFLVPSQLASGTKDKKAMVFSGRLDNQAGCLSVLQAFLHAGPGVSSQIAMFYNHEEIGSLSTQGANSQFFHNVLQRLFYLQGMNQEESLISLVKSKQVSVDAAHGYDPAYGSYFDPGYRPILGRGPVIKESATQRYATNPFTQGWLKDLAYYNHIPLQTMVNKSDIPSGTTIGPISSTNIDIPTIDIGIPILSMHSTRETGSALDQAAITKLLTCFFRDEDSM
jgi:aspartyl aminopeptidase